MNPTLKKLDDVFFVSKILKSRKMAAMLALGFSAGLADYAGLQDAVFLVA